MRGGSGVHTFRVRGFGSMFKDQPEVGLAPSVLQAQKGIAQSAPMRAADMVAFAPQQFMAPLDPSSTQQVFGVRTDGSVGALPVRTTPSLVSSYSPDVDSRAPLEQQVSDASEGAQDPTVSDLPAPDQVPGGLIDAHTVSSIAQLMRSDDGTSTSTTTDDHPAATTGSHWIGGLIVASVLVAIAAGGVALYRAAS